MTRNPLSPAHANRLIVAAGILAVGWMLTGFGYVANVAQTPQALLGIRLFFCILPAVLIFGSLPFLLKYPITRKGHAEVRSKLEKMDALNAGKEG